MRIIKLPRHLYYRHVLIWICLIIYLSFNNLVTGTPFSKFIYIFLFILNFLFVYYLLFLIVFPNFFETQKFVFVISFTGVMVIYILVDYLHLKKVLPFFGGKTQGFNLPFSEFINGSLLLFSFVAFSSLGSFLNWRSIERIKEGAEKEKNVIFRELNFLKNQFHSHLTFNFLNFCYGKMLKSSPKAATSIEDFSEMLRYSLNNKSEEYAPLQKEIDYIH